jgi:hypothetical protein
MRFLKRRHRQGHAKASEPSCPHVALVPRWDDAADIGKVDKVSRYWCEGCEASFSRAEGERMKATAAERLGVGHPRVG